MLSHIGINNWNQLPEWMVSAASVNQFEARLDKFWANQKLKYNHRAQIVHHTLLQIGNVDLESQAWSSVRICRKELRR